MFLAGDRRGNRDLKVRSFLAKDPGISLLLAAVNFEWTVFRAILFLSNRPNAELRVMMEAYYSPEKYKEIWKTEVVIERELEPLAKVIRNWSSVRKAFLARNRLVHGRCRYTRNMATPHVEALLLGVSYIDSYCESIGFPLYTRMSIRRTPKTPK